MIQARNDDYWFEWVPNHPMSDFGRLNVWLRDTVTHTPVVTQEGVLRPLSPDMPQTLIKKGLYYVDKFLRENPIKDRPEEPMGEKILRDTRAQLPDRGLTGYRDKEKPLQLGPDYSKEKPYHYDTPLKVGNSDAGELLEDARTTREWILYWFTAFCSSSGSNTYESKDLAVHAGKMLKKHIPSVIVVLTPAQGEVPDDTSEEQGA